MWYIVDLDTWQFLFESDGYTFSEEDYCSNTPLRFDTKEEAEEYAEVSGSGNTTVVFIEEE